MPSSIQRFVIAGASARDGVQGDSPADQTAGFVTNDFGLFETNLVNAASAVDASGQSSAYQRSEIQPLVVRVQANASTTAAVNTNRDESAAAAAATSSAGVGFNG